MRQILTKDKNFKMLLGSYENIELLEHFLSSVLNIPLKELKGNIRFAKNELDEEVKVVRQSVDVLVNLPTRIIHVEMNPRFYDWGKRREFIYGARIYGNQFTKADDYKKEVNYIQINLNGYKDDTVTKEQDVYYLMTEDKKKWIEDFEIIEINIPYCLNLWYHGDRRGKVRWPSIFGCKDKKEFKKIVGDGRMEKEVKEKLEKTVEHITEDEPVWWDYEKDEQMILNSLKSDAREEGLAEGRAEGRSEGLHQKALEIAQAMMKEKLELPFISKITQIPIEELKKIESNLTNN